MSKPDHYASILKRTGLPPDAVLAIGDGDDDKAAAVAVGAHFVRIEGGAGRPQTGERIVTNLETIQTLGGMTFAPG